MKKKILLLMGVFSIGVALHAQIGIYTDTPQGIFHVDPKKDTSGATNIEDDVIVSNTGRLSIGAGATPLAKVHIKTDVVGKGFRLNDGSQAKKSLLMATDALGTAAWNDPSVKFGIITWKIVNPSGSVSTNAILQANTLANVITETYNVNVSAIAPAVDGITLPAGKYICYINGDVPGQEYFMTMFLVYGTTSLQYNMIHYASGTNTFQLAAATKISLRLNSPFPQGSIVQGQMAAGNYNYWFKLTFLKLS